VKRLLVDVNVALDALLARPPHVDAATRLWIAVEEKRGIGLLPAHGVTTLFHLLARARGATIARRIVADTLAVFEVAPVDQAVLTRALALDWPDFEDAVCAAAAAATACDVIVTRDISGFRDTPVPVVHPAAALALIDEDGGPGRVAERARAACAARPSARRPSRRR
jgi:predicted nucleic acid-binding protein